MGRAIDAEYVEKIFEKWFDNIPDGEETPAIEACLNVVRNAPTLTPPNEPLTLEQLRGMDGAPVWLDVAGGMWALVDALDGCLWLDRGGSIDIAKFAGKAYRRPPEGEADA